MAPGASCRRTPNSPNSANARSTGPESARLWRWILEAVRDVAGSWRSICYSGADPFDNPQCERFIEDFAAVNGHLPYTSTALSVRDPEIIVS